MVVHEAVAMTQPLMSLDHLPKDEEKLPSVTLILKNRKTGIAPGSDMIDRTRIFDSEGSGRDLR